MTNLLNGINLPGGHGYEVKVEGFGHEGEGPGDTKVALYHFQLVVLGDQLHVEGAGHAESAADLPGDLLYFLQSLVIDVPAMPQTWKHHQI